MRSRHTVRAALVLLLVMLASSPGVASVIYESATLGSTGVVTGAGMVNDFFGARFQVTESVQVSQVGGHLFSLGGTLFAAIVWLPWGANTVPTGSPFDDTLQAYTTFTGPLPSADFRIPLSVTLSPGWYALVFGSNEFGAIGLGAMPVNNTDLPAASYITWSGGSWLPFGVSGTRFVVEGDPVSAVPEPGSAALLGAGLLFTAMFLRGRR